jgi:hypothetical protein
MWSSLILMSLLLAGSGLEAQRIGEHVRLLIEDTVWHQGLVVSRDDDRLHVWHPSNEMAYRMAELDEIYVWRRRSKAPHILSGFVGAIAIVALGSALDRDSRPVTSSWGKDFALFGAIGGLLGWHVASPAYCWQRLRN